MGRNNFNKDQYGTTMCMAKTLNNVNIKLDNYKLFVCMSDNVRHM